MSKEEFKEKLKSGHVLYRNGIALIIIGFMEDSEVELVTYKYLRKTINGSCESYVFEYETETLDDTFNRFDADNDYLVKPFLIKKNK